MKPWLLAAGVVLLAVAAGPLLLDGPAALEERPSSALTPDLLERGRLLALAGNCAGCHTARGGAPWAGGRALPTPFGTVYASNLTPDPETGLGRWTPADFWRAIHHGQGIDGRRLVPAFPYTETTRMTRDDSDALFAWLQTLPPVNQPARTHELRWPYGTPWALAAWRLAFFRAGSYEADPAQSAQWNRGAYLVNGVGHCVACHGGRNVLGGTASGDFGGGLIPTEGWYAPAFTQAGQASVAAWPLEDIVAFLRDGLAPQGRAIGPMADVVAASTQHLPDSDLRAMAVYLKALPQEADPAPAALREPALVAQRVESGAALYREHCAACHGHDGSGGLLPDGTPAVPALRGNRMVTQEPPANLVRAIAQGGFGAGTAARPRPFGMPPFVHVLNEEQLASVATFLRRSWGAQASPLSAAQVARWRSNPGP